MVSVIIRLILSAALVYGVYTETGIWTAVAIGLLGLGSEASAFLIKKTNESVAHISKSVSWGM